MLFRLRGSKVFSQSRARILAAERWLSPAFRPSIMTCLISVSRGARACTGFAFCMGKALATRAKVRTAAEKSWKCMVCGRGRDWLK